MFVQGLGQKAPELKIKAYSKKQRADAPKASGKMPASDTFEKSPEAQLRFELMKQVREKIKSGFYDSDSVLDDLSHGFAKAIDPQ